MKKIMMVLISILLFSNVVSANDITVNPDTVDLDLVGGDTITKQITITWTGETAVVGFIETTITPDGDGIDVTYSENPVILYPNLPKVLDMTISVAINIVPDTYLITTDVHTEINEIIKYKTTYETIYEVIYTTVDVENLTRINELLVIIQQLREKINQTTNYTDLLPLITLLQDTFDELTTTIEDVLEEPEPEEKEDKSSLFVASLIIILIMVAIIFVILVAHLHYKFRVLELQRAKELEENEKNK